MKNWIGIRAKRTCKVAFWLICGYLGTYGLLMRRHYPAIDANEQVAFKSAFCLAGVNSTMINGHTATYVRVSFMNYVYAPIDYCYHKYNPSAYKKEKTECDFKARDWIMMR